MTNLDKKMREGFKALAEQGGLAVSEIKRYSYTHAAWENAHNGAWVRHSDHLAAIAALEAEAALSRDKVDDYDELNTDYRAVKERIAALEAERDAAIREVGSIARKFGALEAQNARLAVALQAVVDTCDHAPPVEFVNKLAACLPAARAALAPPVQTIKNPH